jgi:arylformamidase
MLMYVESFMKISLCILALFTAVTSHANEDVAYGPHRAQRLDLHAPANPINAPVMIFIHGGAWKFGDKRAVGEKSAFFNSRGWIFISANYRLLPDGKHPNNVDDVARAIAWVHDNIKKHGGDPDSIFIMGHSAGAHLVALVATDHRPLEKCGKKLSTIKGVIPLDTQAYDLPTLLKDGASRLYTEPFTDDPAIWRDASPITHVAQGRDIPPFLICYSRGMGRRPNPGRPEQANAFAEALRKAGIHAEVVDASDRSHLGINQWFGKPDDNKVTGRAEKFLDALITAGSE